MDDVLIVGGGLAGLTTACLLQQQGLQVSLYEKKTYPFHRVCGEYISNEVVPFLKSSGLYPAELGATNINRFQLTAPNGQSVTLPLALGGFGISRYTLDEFLYKKALALGVDCHVNTTVEKVNFHTDHFSVTTQNGDVKEAKIVIAAHGKRSKLDKAMSRDFINTRSPYVGVKYHIKTDFPDDFIALHNFPQGYCGISRVEEGKTNLCYLSHSAPLKKYGSIEALEQESLRTNPFLKDIFDHAEFLFDKPQVINEVSFAPKQPVEDHVLMVGDSAGLITPLCGNGMAMAFHSAKLVSETILSCLKDKSLDRQMMEQDYARLWRHHFSRRLWVGRRLQGFFGNLKSSSFLVSLAKTSPGIARYLINQTHGRPF